ncbi:MAG: RNA polymerase sigma factor, partial [Phaeodactylibacter sp.]|nr:RNA polymerase sigma factor [Phaeodactylibacter sp.]
MADDKQAKFLQLYEPVHDRFERFCRARVCGQMDFRDLMNDTLLIAYQKLDTLQSDQAFLAYLFGICIRVVANHLRKKREVLYVADETINNIPDPSRADIGAEVYILHQALAKLPDDQRESIILY